MVQNLRQSNNSYVSLGGATNKVLTQGFTTGSDADGYELLGIGVNIEGSGSSFPDGPTSVSVAVHADSSGPPGREAVRPCQSQRVRGRPQLLRGAAGNDAGGEHLLFAGLALPRRHLAQVAADLER